MLQFTFTVGEMDLGRLGYGGNTFYTGEIDGVKLHTLFYFAVMPVILLWSVAKIKDGTKP